MFTSASGHNQAVFRRLFPAAITRDFGSRTHDSADEVLFTCLPMYITAADFCQFKISLASNSPPREIKGCSIQRMIVAASCHGLLATNPPLFPLQLHGGQTAPFNGPPISPRFSVLPVLLLRHDTEYKNPSSS